MIVKRGRPDAMLILWGAQVWTRMLTTLESTKLSCMEVFLWRLQEEVLLSLTIAMAISWLLYSLRPSSANDYAFACFFLICTTSLLKIRWASSDPVGPQNIRLAVFPDKHS